MVMQSEIIQTQNWRINRKIETSKSKFPQILGHGLIEY